ncbi:gastrula zinc finger protein xFG20-1-like protein [Lates japonicus]|uniref:Gastrula zinc finger protein xFG20-1-like protein n=1 Tax=Lates japonicus TaxID=270547 RepID=A0AAD3RE73_LATJO|nr:gastrula zinc finger protein xFG20-1-like protein [Lates japonicus]
MCKIRTLRTLVNQRLSTAVEEIFRLFETTIAEYEEEIERQRRLLEVVERPVSQENKADVVQMSVIKEDPEPPHIKEEQEEIWSSQPSTLQVKMATEVEMTDPSWHQMPSISRRPVLL